jgi:hypothetical protein
MALISLSRTPTPHTGCGFEYHRLSQKLPSAPNYEEREGSKFENIVIILKYVGTNYSRVAGLSFQKAVATLSTMNLACRSRYRQITHARWEMPRTTSDRVLVLSVRGDTIIMSIKLAARIFCPSLSRPVLAVIFTPLFHGL